MESRFAHFSCSLYAQPVQLFSFLVMTCTKTFRSFCYLMYCVAAHTEVFPCSGGATHADECKCGTARLVSNELFDTAVALVLQDLESHYFPVFITVNPFFLAFVQLYHFCCTRKPMNLRSWKWIGRIGRGGYGAVFLVQRIETGMTVLPIHWQGMT